MVIFNPAIYNAAGNSIRAAFAAGDASPILPIVLPGWAKPLTFRISYTTWGLLLTNGDLNIEVMG